MKPSIKTFVCFLSLIAVLVSCSSKERREGVYDVPLKQQMRDAERKLEKAANPPNNSSTIPEDKSQPEAKLETQIIFPVIGQHKFVNDWGNARVGHTHKGTDVIAKKMLPIVAAADGVVSWLYKKDSGKCCYLAIDHDGDWQTRYIHMNNDTEGTDDGKGNGIVEGLEEGTVVKAGQLIGWVGDSGNAEETTAHLHFEILIEGANVNPYPYLKAARHIEKPIDIVIVLGLHE